MCARRIMPAGGIGAARTLLAGAGRRAGIAGDLCRSMRWHSSYVPSPTHQVEYDGAPR